MKKFSTFLLALIACAGTMFAERVQIGDLYYNLNADNKTAEVTYQEEWSETNYSYLTAVNIPESVEYNSVAYSVTSIGERAFYGCSGLTSIEIPNSVTSIGNYAFAGCSGLTSIEIPNSVTSIGDRAFGYCSGLTSVTIPNSVTSIENGTFIRCTGLTSIEIPNSVTNIDNSAFLYCSGLTSIVVASGNTTYDSRENCNAIIETSTNTLIAGCQNTIIPTSVTSIGEWAFATCSGLTSIEIPNSVTSIGSGAFSNVPNIVYSGSATGSPWGARSVNGYVDGYLVYSDNTKTTLLACSSSAEGEIVIPNSVTSIGDHAFYGCTGLTSIEIPNSVTSIGNYAFAGCSGLTSIEIPNSVTSIGNRAFRDCSGLTSVTIPNSVTSFGWGAFESCSGLTSVTIGNSVTSIGDYAFTDCSGLTSIEIPNSVTSIGSGAFSSCSGLTSIVVASGNTNYDSRENCNAIIETSTNTLIAGCKSTIIPNSVTSIGERAFYGCSGLTSIEIPNSVTSFGWGAFESCSGLTSVTIGNSVTSIGEHAFAYCSGLTSVTNYATTPQTIESNVFDYVDLSSCTLYVPEGSIGLYQAAEVWKDFTNIQAIDTEDIDQIQLNSTVKNHKILYNGNVYILTGDKTYTVTGQQLK